MTVRTAPQFPPRLLLAGAVVTALTASGGTVLTFPTATSPGPAAAPVAAAAPAAPASPVAPAEPVTPGPPPVATGADIASLAAGSAGAVVGVPVEPATPARPEPTTREDTVAPDRAGLSEADWARLPVSLRQRVRLACDQGYLSGPHCAHA